ncbi:A/G-specific adenine glycosylase [bacterium]|nr:A/G-specific adenine glycosylase [bacterium]
MNPCCYVKEADVSALRRALLRWYRRHGRSLPWRETRDPYRVWVSEIMLQQTTVATVLGYYERFLERFPTISDLARGDEQEVLHLWQGLGYYRRARHLHRAAQFLARTNGGKFPTHLAEIEKLPGFGKYTARAVACFALHQSVPIIEANTRRLWCRVAGAEGDPTRGRLEAELWEMSAALAPKKGAWDFQQAAMDLGAMICTPRSPSCSICPLADHCEAHRLGKEEDLPQLPAKRSKVDIEHASVVLWNKRGEVLIRQRPPDGTWAGLWEFPLAELAENETPRDGIQRTVGQQVFASLRWTGRSHLVRHAIMHYRVKLTCLEATVGRQSVELPSSEWRTVDRLRSLPWSTPQRKLLIWLEKVGPPAQRTDRPPRP